MLESFVETVGNRYTIVKGDAEAFVVTLKSKGLVPDYAGVLSRFGIDVTSGFID